MGFLDKFKAKSTELRGRAEETISANSDKIDSGLDKAADAARKATKGKYDHQIHKATAKAKEGVDRIDKGKGGNAGNGPA
ncbi:MAG: Rv0909 family putative TA system antitoxin [Nocardioidaceae bacterium]